MIEYLFLETRGYGVGTNQITVTKNDGRVVQKKYAPLSWNPEKHTKWLNLSEASLFFEELNKLKITNWKKHYENYEILDGEQWVLRYREAGEKVKTIEGSNDYPKEWEDLIELIEGVAPVLLYEEDEEVDDFEEERQREYIREEIRLIKQRRAEKAALKSCVSC